MIELTSLKALKFLIQLYQNNVLFVPTGIFWIKDLSFNLLLVTAVKMY